MEWYFTVSHPCIIPPVEHTNDVGAYDIGVPVNDVPLPSPTTDVDDQQHLQMIAVIMYNLTSLVNPDGEVYTGLSRATHIVSKGSI